MLAGLLHQEEGWLPAPGTRLPKLNMMTMKNTYPLPLIQTSSTMFRRQGKYFMKLDILGDTIT